MCDTSDLEVEIRDFINNPRKQFRLLQDASAWNMLCSALDVIGDTQLAIDAYLENPSSDSHGKAYLTVYGILQVLLVQQDAVKCISKALSLKLKLPKNLERIRTQRTDSVGHPMQSKEEGRYKSNFIVRSSLSESGFNLMTVYSDDTPLSVQFINIPQLIKEQRELLKQKLREVVGKLKEEEMKHKEEFRDKKLKEVFPPALGYFFRKIFEATRGNKPLPIGEMHVKLVGDCLQDFKALLEERQLWGVLDSVTYGMELAQYPLNELALYFENPDKSKLNERDAFIFASFLREQINELKQIATEIDEEYDHNN